MRPPTVIVTGELLWDLFPDAERLGGAPANFAVHAAALGGRVSLVSAVGHDRRGDSALRVLGERGVDTRFVRRTNAPTGTVNVALRDGHPDYEIVENVAWDEIACEEELAAALAGAEVFCWGSLAQRTESARAAHMRMLGDLPESCLKVFDVNFRQSFHSARVVRGSLVFADILKVNEAEVETLYDYLGARGDTFAFAMNIRDWFGIDCVVITRGAQGCAVIDETGEHSFEAPEVMVKNTVGAGDAFTAAFSLSRAAGKPLGVCARAANEVGAFVSSQDGGTPVLPEGTRVFG